MRQPRCRHRRDRDRATVGANSPALSKSPSRPLSTQSDRSLPRTRLFHCVALDGGFPTEARRLPMLAVEMEITAEFYSVSKQVITFVSTNDIIRLNKCHEVSPIVLAVSRDNHELLICPVSVTACGCYSAEHSHTIYIRISAGARNFSKNEVRSIVHYHNGNTRLGEIPARLQCVLNFGLDLFRGEPRRRDSAGH